MLEIAIMVEGQNGLTWPRWQRISAAVEDLGFVGLYRSDHFTNASPPDKESLELWVSLTWLASHTRRIEFGPLVSPVSFRHPVFTARMAAAVDDLSGGRLILGLGAGWQMREHQLFGFDLLPLKSRCDRFEEAVQVIRSLLRNRAPVTFAGHYYALQEALLLPPPLRPSGPPILIGGNGEQRTLTCVARYADEWNGICLMPDAFTRLNKKLDDLLLANDRQPQSVRRSMMTGLRFACERSDLETRISSRNQTKDELIKRGFIIGVSDEVLEPLQAFEAAGVQRIMLQWLDLDDIANLEALAKVVFP